ncbi:Peptidyl-tRNA hydrolase [Frankliniella fusca]|uniref:Peptidyl-tRNA hydrolase n=1 Tax=Frankliniella fusca TaxID=407009 RepID=A0AAE1I4D3_9NEOP|nr:Peptidyl-tRNA hydrolase [Frankliniella fusca]
MDAGTLKAVLAGNVKQILPHKSNEQLDSIADFLIDEGVKKEADLRHMTINILKGVLDTVDASDASAASEISNGRIPVFHKNCPYIPVRVREAINSGKKPQPSERQDMVDRIVDHCRDKIPDLVRRDFVAVAKQLVEMYPKSFKDTLPSSETGHDSLAYQLQNKFDNDNRWLKKTPAERNRTPLQRPEAFGCVKWTCEIPLGETKASLLKKKKQLSDTYVKGKRHWDWRKLTPDMEATFCLQRVDINGPEQVLQRKSRKRKQPEVDETDDSDFTESRKTLLDIKDEWPFLFHARGINIHFMQLTGVDFCQNLEDFLSGDGKTLINYLALNSEKLESIRRKMQRFEGKKSSSALIALVRMIQEFFKEPLEEFASYVEETTEFEEVQEKAKIPDDGIPFLVVAGDSLYDCRAFYLFIDSKPVATCEEFAEAFVLWFSSFYAFNLMYATKLASSLIYIQKVIAQISSKGLKCRTAAIQSAANKKANKLNDQFQLYKQKLDEENAD